MPAMNSKKKNIVEEPAEVYEVTPSNEVASQNNDVWEQLPRYVKDAIDLGLEQSDKGLTISHDEVMRLTKEKFPFLNGI
jgi:predicted transcriptional regulator